MQETINILKEKIESLQSSLEAVVKEREFHSNLASEKGSKEWKILGKIVELEEAIRRLSEES